jgi:hypothetical protein
MPESMHVTIARDFDMNSLKGKKKSIDLFIFCKVKSFPIALLQSTAMLTYHANKVTTKLPQMKKKKILA